jgi:O-acetyl-ADP-ribose deacetylase (regulator of RNase III)
MPQLIAKFTLPTAAKSNQTSMMKRRRSIEVWTTTCIVSNFGKTNTKQQPQPQQQLHNNSSNDGDNESVHPQCTTLINPANPYLSGPYTFPYFPRGGPQPPQIKSYKNAHPIMGYVSQWGGMDVGSGMVFPAQTIDGLVHQLGGEQLRSECLSIQPPSPRRPLWLDNNYGNVMSEEVETTKKLCPEGMAVQTSSGGPNLRLHYDNIIHTTPPFYNYPPLPLPHIAALEKSNNDDDDDDSNKVHAWSKELLRLCYRHSFDLAFNNNTNNSINNNRSVYKHNNGWRFQSVLQNLMMSIFSSSSPNRSNPSSLTTTNNNNCAAASGTRRIAVPLLGAGCRGFPTSIALDIAANESLSWLLTTTDEENNNDRLVVYQEDDDTAETTQDEDVIVFGLLEKEDANQLSARVYQGILLQKTNT